MSICLSGTNCKIKSGLITIKIQKNHPLIILANLLCWETLVDLVLPDIKKTGGQWHLGRKLKLRMHLGAYLLQQLLNKTDRQMEYELKDNAAYQLFCGVQVVENWHSPDHTKIAKFRSRLSSETQKNLANYIATHAVKLGFANPNEIDIDSTVQEANMAYPADSTMLKKLGLLSKKAADYLNTELKAHLQAPLMVNLKRITSKARAYFFLPKNASKEQKDHKLKTLLNVVRQEAKPVIQACESLTEVFLKAAPWNIRRTLEQIKILATPYLKDVRSFLKHGVVVPTKRLSFHLSQVACFTKGKPGKRYQFGRAFQLARLGGNFLVSCSNTSIQMPDKSSLPLMISELFNLFGPGGLSSVGTDKGYYSYQNEQHLSDIGVKEIAIQRPVNIKRPRICPLTAQREEELVNRRSGIEPLIGHAKQKGQLGRSRMKSDETINASGYAAILAFNLRQLIRCKKKEMLEEAAGM